jgi:hypothetical protein
MSVPDLDIFTEPDADPDTLANLGPLAAMAGSFEGTGSDSHPVPTGAAEDAYVERYELEPIDPQTNGPQLLYGLRYHIFITKPGQRETFHDQVGYWLWEPATGSVFLTIAIPRAQVALASGVTDATATRFELRAERGLTSFGICSGPFLESAFRTVEYRIAVTIDSPDSWSYEQDTVLEVAGRSEPFHHIDRNTLRRVAPAVANPKVRYAAD